MQMLRAISAITLLVVAVFNTSKLLGTIRLNDVMNLDEQKKTGISQLTDTQKQALEAWINQTFVLKTTNSEPETLTLQRNLQNGSQLELSDGSIYAIAPADQSKTTFWLTPISIKVSQSEDPVFPTLLTNTLTGVDVKAKLITAPRSKN